MQWIQGTIPFFRGSSAEPEPDIAEQEGSREAQKEDRGEPQGEARASPVRAPHAEVPSKAGIDEHEEEWDDRLLSCQVASTYPVIDVFRAGCAACVVLDLGSAKFSNWNVLFCQAWVLQWSFVIGGVCYAISRRPLCSYMGRLGLYLAMGASSNWAASIVTDPEWTSFKSAFHQLWFIAGLMVFALVFAPVKQNLRQVRQRHADGDLPTLFRGNDLTHTTDALAVSVDACISLWVLTADRMSKWWPRSEMMGNFWAILRQWISFFGVDPATLDAKGVCLEFPLTVWALSVAWLMNRLLFQKVIVPTCVRLMIGPLLASWPSSEFYDPNSDPEEDATALISSVVARIFPSAMSVMLTLIYPKLSNQVSKVAWLIVINNYGLRLFLPKAPQAVELVFVSFDAWFLGLVCFHYGVWRRQVVCEYLMRYWFLLLWICSVVCPTGPLLKRDDPRPVAAAHFHAGEVAVEMFLMVFFLVAMEALIDPKMLCVRKSRFLRAATVPMFLFHRATYLVFPAPLNWGILAAIVALRFRCGLTGWSGMAQISSAVLKPSC